MTTRQASRAARRIAHAHVPGRYSRFRLAGIPHEVIVRGLGPASTGIADPNSYRLTGRERWRIQTRRRILPRLRALRSPICARSTKNWTWCCRRWLATPNVWGGSSVISARCAGICRKRATSRFSRTRPCLHRATSSPFCSVTDPCAIHQTSGRRSADPRDHLTAATGKVGPLQVCPLASRILWAILLATVL